MADAAVPVENPEVAPCHLPPELWAIVFSHVSGDFYLTTRAAFLAACRAYAEAALALRPPEPGVFLGVREFDGTLRRGRRISAETFALYEERLQPLGLIAWPTEPAAVGFDVAYAIHSHTSAPIPPGKVYDFEFLALLQSARDVASMIHTHVACEALAAWVADHVPAGSDLHVRLRELSEHARVTKSEYLMRTGCYHSMGYAPDIGCPDCPTGWKAPLTGDLVESQGDQTIAFMYAVVQKKTYDLSSEVSRHLEWGALDGPILLPPWHVTFSRLHEFGATVVPRNRGADPGAASPISSADPGAAAGAVRLDRIVRLLPAVDVRVNALTELLERLRAAGAVLVDPAENAHRGFDNMLAAMLAEGED